MAAVSECSVHGQQIPRLAGCNSPEKFSSAETRSLRILPMRSTSVTIPVAIKAAHTLTASDANSGDDSAVKAGVRAELI